MITGNLNEMQRLAVETTEGPLLVLAGAGSGKTSMMTNRIAYLIQEKGVSPYHILAVTFTNKAATEMRERVSALGCDAQAIWILTFHATCLRILRNHIDELGYEKGFTIYDSVDQKAAIKECIKKQDVDEKTFTVNYLQKIISDSKNNGINAARFTEQNDNFYKDKVVAKVYTDYERLLKRNNALDFDDLLLLTVKLFETQKEVLEKYRNRFQYIMVDEYQDTNQVQYKLIKLLAQKHENICVVGDDDQCIYQWRGADIRNILDFEKDFNRVKVIKLEQNYRSTSCILEAAYSVIRNNSDRKEKKLWTEAEVGEKIRVYGAEDEKKEAYFIADEIDRIKSKTEKYKDMAILYRTHAQSRNFEEVFINRGIPYKVFGGTRYYERKEIKDLIAYMRLVFNPSDNMAFKRIINYPKRGIGPQAINKMEAAADLENTSLWEIIREGDFLETFTPKSKENIQAFSNLISENREKLEAGLAVSDLYDAMLKESGYLETLEKENTIESKGRIENIMEFKSVIYDYEDTTETPNIEEFLEKITLMSDADTQEEGDSVLMMTLHSAKGLEFNTVFMPGMEENIFPGRRSRESLEELEEERRLCYVGITRARKLLYMTHAQKRMLYGRTEYNPISSFMGEINQKLIEDLTVIKEPLYKNSKATVDFGVKDQLKYFKGHGTSSAHGIDKVVRPEGEKPFTAMDQVKHFKFGKGTIVSVDGSSTPIATILFDSVGIKKLMVDKLEKL